MIENDYELLRELKKEGSFFEEVIKMLSKTDREAMNNPTIENYLFFDYDTNEFEIINKYNCWGVESEFAEGMIEYYYEGYFNKYLFKIYYYDDYPDNNKYIYNMDEKERYESYKEYEEVFDAHFYNRYKKELLRIINSMLIE